MDVHTGDGQAAPALIGPSGIVFRVMAWSVTVVVALFGLLIGFGFVLHWCVRVSLTFFGRCFRSLLTAASRTHRPGPLLHPPAR
jgi:hypothetical protein